MSWSWSDPAVPSPFKILFLTHKTKTYDAFMDRYFVNQYRAAKRREGVEAVMWGLDFRGYNNSATIRENLVRRYGGVHFDMIFLFGVTHNHELAALSKETVVMIREHECWGKRCEPYIIYNDCGVVQFTFSHEISQYRGLGDGRVFQHSPTCAEPRIFYRAELDAASRPVQVLIAGSISKDVYPLRSRMVELVNSGRIKGAVWYKHPGYMLDAQNGTSLPEPDDGGIHPLDAQVMAFAEQYRTARVCLVTTSVHKYALQKYAEAALAGCALVGNIPHDRPDFYREFVTEVNVYDSDEHIINTIQALLDDEPRRMKLAMIGQKRILETSTWDHWLDITKDAYVAYKKKQFGRYYPYGYFPESHLLSILNG